jgi:hypothetical protein
MQSLQERIDDALMLWREGRREGAFLLAIVAVIARARRDFPSPMGEGESFRRFIEAKFPTRISVEYQGKCWPLEQVFYKWFRCEIVHRGGLPLDLRFMDGADADELSVRAGGATDYTLLIAPGWFDRLIEWART